MTNNFFSRSEEDFEVLCNVVYVLPREYDRVTEVVEIKDCEEEELAKHKAICYFMMNNRCIKE